MEVFIFLILGLLAILVMLFMQKGSAAARWELHLFPTRKVLVRHDSSL
jgi:hypothetical protein